MNQQFAMMAWVLSSVVSAVSFAGKDPLTTYLNEIESVSTRIEPAISLRTDHRTALAQATVATETSVKGRPLLALRFGPEQARRRILFIGCIHADEWAACYTSWRLTQKLLEGNFRPWRNTAVMILPTVNPDGLIEWQKSGDGFVLDDPDQSQSSKRRYPTRRNANGVDLNRNFYSRNLHPNHEAEPETEFVLDRIEEFRPTHMVALHAARNELDLDYRGKRDLTQWLEAIHKAARRDIPIDDSPTYGSRRGTNWSLGHWAERRRGLPSLTFELPHPKSPMRRPRPVRGIARDFLPAVKRALFLR
jgi:hypothetical protein